MAALRALNAAPHVARNASNRRSAIDGRTTRHRGVARVGRMCTLTAAAHTLVRLPRLLAA